MVFDTGSGHVVVPSDLCRSSACQSHRRYSQKLSNSGSLIHADGRPLAGDTKDEMDISFGTGSLTGDLIKEAICLGSTPRADAPEKPRESCVELSVVVATTMSDDPFQLFEFDGIFGLGLPRLSVHPNFNFLAAFGASGHAQLAEFGIWMATAWDAKKEPNFGGELALGGHDPRRLIGPLAWVPVADPELGHWQVSVLGIRIGSESLDICSTGGGCTAVVDTGTSHLGIPKDHTRNLFSWLSVVPGADKLCYNTNASQLHFDLPGGVTLTLQGRDYLHPSPAQKSGFCRPKVMPVTLPVDMGQVFLFGEPILLRYYTVFRWRAMQVGFGLAAPHDTEGTQALESDFGDAVILVQVSAWITRRSGPSCAGL